MNDLYNATGILNTVLMLCVIIGGYIAIKSSKNQQASTIQSQVIDALKAELDTLQHRIEALEKENARLTQTIDLIRLALKQRGILVTIDGGLVTISDNKGNSQSARIQEDR